MNQLLRRPYQKMFKTDQRTYGNSLLVSLVCGVHKYMAIVILTLLCYAETFYRAL